ncbi:Reverse transcriptase-like [Sesbania bispinosa]|nr:Reverse transcriptase-like [Sesbania bispinosa]
MGYPHPQDSLGANSVAWGGTSNAIWQLWRCRNEVVFDNQTVGTEAVVSRIKNLARIGDDHSLSSMEQGGRGLKLVCWCGPEEDWIKFNVDGSVRCRSAGCGGVMRDHYGNWMGGFSFNMGSSSVLMAELRGCYCSSYCLGEGYIEVVDKD